MDSGFRRTRYLDGEGLLHSPAIRSPSWGRTDSHRIAAAVFFAALPCLPTGFRQALSGTDPVAGVFLLFPCRGSAANLGCAESGA